MIVEEFDNGHICIHRYEDNTVFMSVNNDFQEIPEWNRSIQILNKKFSCREAAEKFFFELKKLVEFEEETEKTPKIPEGYVPVAITSLYYGSHPEYGEDDITETYYCRPEHVEELKKFKLTHGHSGFGVEAKRFYLFCLKNDVLDEEFFHPSDTDNFSVVGAYCYTEQKDWKEE